MRTATSHLQFNDLLVGMNGARLALAPKYAGKAKVISPPSLGINIILIRGTTFFDAE